MDDHSPVRSSTFLVYLLYSTSSLTLVEAPVRSRVDLATRMVYQAMSSPSLENMSRAPSSHPNLSLRYQASIYSVHSSYGYRNNSLECLVPDKKRVRFEDNERPKTARGVKPKRRMASNGNGSGAMNIERKMSYGIGGAGNIRRFPCLLCPVLYGMGDVMLILACCRETFRCDLPRSNQPRWHKTLERLVQYHSLPGFESRR
jgi:hypothetical protein